MNNDDKNNNMILAAENQLEYLMNEELYDEETDEETDVDLLSLLSMEDQDCVFNASHLNDNESEESEEKIMTAREYLNRSKASSSKAEAAAICQQGVLMFPSDVPLLTQCIHILGVMGEDLDLARSYFESMRRIPFNKWTLDSFREVTAFLLKEDPHANEGQCRLIIEVFKKFFPFSEDPMIYESELESKIGNDEKRFEILQNAMSDLKHCWRAAEILADLQVKRGCFQEALTTIDYGLAAAVLPDCRPHTSYLLLLRVLCEDHLLTKRLVSNEGVSKSELEALLKQYEFLDTNTVAYWDLAHYHGMIRSRKAVIEFLLNSCCFIE